MTIPSRCCVFIALLLASAAMTASADTSAATGLPSARATYNFDIGWKFIRQDVPGAEVPAFDDAAWTIVSTPHTYNDTDTFNRIISHGGGQQGAYMGVAWYRKHFSLPATVPGHKAFLEFEGMRQAGQIFLNGKPVGLSENGVNAYGLDITNNLASDGRDNVLAVRVDNSANYTEKATGTGFEWESKDFNPNYGGINRHVWLHITGLVHQTLPLYDGLQTTGVYIYPSNISTTNNTATIHVESQVANESDHPATVTLSAMIVDGQNHTCARFDGETTDLAAGSKATLNAAGPLASVRLWSPESPTLYRVYTILSVDGKTVDTVETNTGFRRTQFRGGTGTGGVYINDQFTYLTGYAQRSTNEWAGLGQAYPDWMHDLTAKLIRDSHANYIRWMHISPQRVDVSAFDRAGIVEICPAGDKEKDVTGRQWQQRVEVMRNSMIYFRNSPSILFWEAGNNSISPQHMQEMVDLKSKWDPNGGRAMGCRSLHETASNAIAEYFGVMVGEDRRIEELKSPEDLFRAYSAQRRDRAPLIEAEDFRDEAARRFWDEYSPPHLGGFKPGPKDTYHWNSDTFCLAAAARYWAYWQNRISNTDPRHARWSGYASIYFSDSNADGRQDSSEVARASGKVDAVRLPKDAYYAYRVMQSPGPDLHILGHWVYPPGTKKTVYVIANHCQAVELSLNGKFLGRADHPADGYVFSFSDISWQAGTLSAAGYAQGAVVCHATLTTAGPAKAVKLTPLTGPDGLQADGQDVVLFDVEVIDAAGQRCPTDEGRIDFAISGPGVWRGGYNSGKINSTNNLYLDTECGINRIAIRATCSPGVITLTATRPGLEPGKVWITAAPVVTQGGLSAASDHAGEGHRAAGTRL
jgi:beta-galactosidase